MHDSIRGYKLQYYTFIHECTCMVQSVQVWCFLRKSRFSIWMFGKFGFFFSFHNIRIFQYTGIFWYTGIVDITNTQRFYVLVSNMEKGKFTFVYLYVFINQECGHYEKILDRLGRYIKDQGLIFSH